MLSYRHHFHAGNFADVFKHAILVLLIESLRKKDTPFGYLETHAGAALYDLREPAAQKNREFDYGIAKLLALKSPPEELGLYLEIVRKFNRGNDNETIQTYPGSPRIVRELLRPQDGMILCERHPADAQTLKQEFHRDPQVSVHFQDGYQGLKAFLPLKQKRGLVLIDPAYELKEETQNVMDGLELALSRFANGIYAIWYPLMARQGQSEIERLVKARHIKKALCAELFVQGDNDTDGMTGCGLIIVNPPYQLDQKLNVLLPPLDRALRQTAASRYRISWLTRE